MSWNNSLYTNIGTDMMSEMLSGATMTMRHQRSRPVFR